MTNYISKLDYKPKNISYQISALLKEAIVNNELQRGEQIVESHLQKKLGVSRSPIREAMRELEKLGLVTIEPRKGTFVKNITPKDIRENYEVRAPLEGLAAKQAAGLMLESDHRKLSDTLTLMQNAVDDGNEKRYWKHHSTYHNVFIFNSGNSLLINFLNILRTHSFWHRMSFPYPEEDLQASVDTHQLILQMFKDPDQDHEELGQYVTRHILDVLPGVLKNIENMNT